MDDDATFWREVAQRLARELAQYEHPGAPDHMLDGFAEATVCGAVMAESDRERV